MVLHPPYSFSRAMVFPADPVLHDFDILISVIVTYNLRGINRVVARMRHWHLALVDAAGPAVAGVDPVAGITVARHVEVVVVARHLSSISCKN